MSRAGSILGHSVLRREDAALLVLSGPRADLLPRETAALERFVAGGGSLRVMIDPMAAPNKVLREMII